MELSLLKREDLPAEIITVSPSQMSQWYRCRYAWKLSRIDGVGKETFRESGAANKGLIFHAFCDWYYKKCVGGPVLRLNPKGQMQALEHVQKEYGSDPALYQVFAIFLAYVDYYVDRETGTCLASEQECWAATGLVSRDGIPIYLHGFIDIILDVMGSLIFMDHKSHTNRPWTKDRLFYDHQFLFYWLLLELQGITVDGAYVNAVNLFVPSDSKKFNPTRIVGQKNSTPRFERIHLGPNEIKPQFYLDQFLENIKAMWCGEPSYPMRLSSDCQYCTFRDHIELDAKGLGEGSIATLKARHNSEAYELVDDLEPI